jgi:hypothetical protein
MASTLAEDIRHKKAASFLIANSDNGDPDLDTSEQEDQTYSNLDSTDTEGSVLTEAPVMPWCEAYPNGRFPGSVGTRQKP